MNKKAEVVIYGTLGIFTIFAVIFGVVLIGSLQGISAEPQNWVIQGDSVYIDDSNVFINVTPHTSNNPIISLKSKVFSGQIDVVVGFNTSQAYPTGASYPKLENITKTYTCNGENKFFNYTINPNHFWCWENQTTYNEFNQTNGSILNLIFNHSFIGGDIFTGTAYWDEKEIVWTDVSQAFSSADVNFLGYNKWYYVQGFNINANQTYDLKLQLKQTNAFGSHKYFFGVKPSTETLQQAIANGHFYYIDPWTFSGATKTYHVEGGYNYTVLTYLNNGTFNTTNAITGAKILVIAGGGGSAQGAGGAGGYYYNSSYTIPVGNYNVFVGLGGDAGQSRSVKGGYGQNSSFNDIIMKGGGGGGMVTDLNGTHGGSGGGGGGHDTVTTFGGRGTTGQGRDGGGNGGIYASPYPSGGGGGAGGSGLNATTGVAGNGGVGLSNNITNGTTLWYAGGGGGGVNLAGTGGTGGIGGGGNGSNGAIGWAGINGTGGGGGGSQVDSDTLGARGGNGIVIIKYISFSINLNSPENYYNSTSNLINFNATIETTGSMVNVSLLINGNFNETNTSGIEGEYIFDKILSDGVHTWGFFGCDGNECINTTQRTLTVDVTPPTISLPTYSNATLENSSKVLNLNVSLSDAVSGLSKTSCFADVNGTNQSLAYSGDWCNGTISLTGTSQGNQTIKVWANDTFNNWGLNNSYVIVIDNSAPNITINTPTGTVTTLSTPFNVSLQEIGNFNTCIAWVMRGASVEVANTTLVCPNGTIGDVNGTVTVSGDANYNFFVWVNDSFGNVNSSSSTFIVDTSTPSNPAGTTGGGGGGSIVQEVPAPEQKTIRGAICLGFKDALSLGWDNLMKEFNIDNFILFVRGLWDSIVCRSAGSIVPV